MGVSRTNVPVYASMLGVTPARWKAAADWALEQGYPQQKWALRGNTSGNVSKDKLNWLTGLFDYVAGKSELTIDAIRSWSLPTARRLLPELADLGVRWVEEPVSSPWLLHKLDVSAPLIAAGEQVLDLADQWHWALGEEIAVWQPEVGANGGVVHTMHLAAAAHVAGKLISPHAATLRSAMLLARLAPPEHVTCLELHVTLDPARQFFEHPLVVRDGLLSLDGPDDLLLGPQAEALLAY